MRNPLIFLCLYVVIISCSPDQEILYRLPISAKISYVEGEDCESGWETVEDCDVYCSGEVEIPLIKGDRGVFIFNTTTNKNSDPVEVKGSIGALAIQFNTVKKLYYYSGMFALYSPVSETRPLTGVEGKYYRVDLEKESEIDDGIRYVSFKRISFAVFGKEWPQVKKPEEDKDEL